MGPSLVPSFVPLKGSLKHCPRLEIHFSLKGLELVEFYETVSKSRAITLKLTI